MYNALLKMLRQYDMVQPGDTVTCAVSGGADSVALLWGMYLLKEKLGITLRAAHFNHHLRGEESDRDEAFVRTLCDRYDIPLTVGGAYVKAGKKGLEAAARDARYAFFETLEGKVATAHTADDNAETVLMHMVRGTGLKGLGGISPVRDRFIRPMLGVTREMVLVFLQDNCLSFVSDSSNDADVFLRNRLRHRVMPLLRQENPRIAENLSAMALRLRQDEEALSAAVDFSDGLLLEDLLGLAPAVQSRSAAAFLRSAGVKEPDAEHISLVLELATSDKPSARACFPGGITVCRRYDRLVAVGAEEAPEPVPLPCPGAVSFGETTVCCRPAAPGTPGAVCAEGTMLVRSRKSGDCMRLPGGTKSLKKLFIDRKIPADRRSFVAVVADDKGVLAVEDIGANMDRCGNGPAVCVTFLKKEK